MIKLAVRCCRVVRENSKAFRAKLRVAPKVEVVPMTELKKILFSPMSRKPNTVY